MGADVPLIVVAIGSALCFVVACVAVVVLCLRALRQGNYQFEGEIKAPSMTMQIRVRPVAGTADATCDCGAADKQHIPVSHN
jgi:hypothetical protein